MQVINRLLKTPCYIIDFLPQQVPKECGGQFFKVEDYLFGHNERYGLKDRLIRVILKIMCYYPISVYCHGWIEQPTPEQVAVLIDGIREKQVGDVNILFASKDVLLQLAGDSLNINIYNPDEEMSELFEKIAVSEGLFWRKAE